LPVLSHKEVTLKRFQITPQPWSDPPRIETGHETPWLQHCQCQSKSLGGLAQTFPIRQSLLSVRLKRKHSQVIELSSHLRNSLPKEHTFDWLLNVQGKVWRSVKHRRTIELTVDGRKYFIKIHCKCGWKELFKDLISGRPPIVSARTEWLAIERLQALGIPTLTVSGKGERGYIPAYRESFLITEALENMVSLEELIRDWGELTEWRRSSLKHSLIGIIAEMARILHQSGTNHRDFYLCHFLVRQRDWSQWQQHHDPLTLHLIDLHRVQIRSRTPERWRIKDLGGLLFSALDCGLTRRDLLRFIRAYEHKSWSRLTTGEKRLWARVWRNANKLYRSFHGRTPPKLG
jgi:lipopolysaccharide core heptose(I) kinase